MARPSTSEVWVSPVGDGREAPPPWRTVWPFRILLVVALLAIIALAVYLIITFNLTGTRAPGVSAG